MKKHLSVFMLTARGSIYHVLVLLAAMAASELALFYFALWRALPDGSVSAPNLEQILSSAGFSGAFRVALILMTLFLCLPWIDLGGVRQEYALKRLSVQYREIFLWSALYNAICYLFLWVCQLGVMLLMSRIFITRITDGVTSQTVFLAFYRNNFMHALLPLNETSLWIRNFILVACLGISAARFPFARRSGGLGISAAVVPVVVCFFFERKTGNIDMDAVTILVSLFFAGYAISCTLPKEEKDNA